MSGRYWHTYATSTEQVYMYMLSDKTSNEILKIKVNIYPTEFLKCA